MVTALHCQPWGLVLVQKCSSEETRVLVFKRVIDVHHSQIIVTKVTISDKRFLCIILFMPPNNPRRWILLSME